jgi:predicted amidohydrolase YtcJ
MKLCTIFHTLILGCVSFYGVSRAALGDELSPPDLIIYNARVATVDSTFIVQEALAVRDGLILATGKESQIKKMKGPRTRMVDAHGGMVLPGLCDNYVHSYEAAVSELAPLSPKFDSIASAQAYIRAQAAKKNTNDWIVVTGAYPSRIKEGRLPAKAELDEAAPKNPVYWESGDMVMLNSEALKLCRITNGMKIPAGCEIVFDPLTLKPTGLLRHAASLVKLSPPAPTPSQERAALRHLYQLYNEQGITSIGERRAGTNAIDLFRDLENVHELTVRIHCSRFIEPGAALPDALGKLEQLTNSLTGKLPYGPTGVGDDWVRIGALNVQMDGDLREGASYLRTPWGMGPTYQITEPAYRGELQQDSELLVPLFVKAAQQGWQITADCSGDATLDELLNCYQRVQFQTDIHLRRFGVSRSIFQAVEDWDRCRQLGIVSDAQPAWLYRDGDSLLKTMGEKRLRHFLSFKGWFEHHLIVGGGSDHASGLDSENSVNPWNPWLGIWITLTRQTDSGAQITPQEILSREQAIRLYTCNNAYLNFDEEKLGSLEPGKLADLIIIDRDILKCPVDEVRNTKVQMTVVGGKIVWENKDSFPLANAESER